MSGKPPSGRCTGLVRKVDRPSCQLQITSPLFITAFLAFFSLAVSFAHAGTAVHVSISPAHPSVFSSLTQQFTATVTNTNDTRVTWSTTKGKISNTGLYTAPVVSSETTASVTATSVADPTKSATATVTVMPPVKVSVTPTGVVMNSGKTQPFKATVTGSVRNGVTWSATKGTISSSGLFTAPTVSTITNVSVTATSVADPKVSSSVSLIVNPPINVSSDPGNISLPSAELQQFTATVKNTGDTRVTWSSSIGHVAPSGLYTAPDVTTETSAVVTATSVADKTKSSTSTVKVTPVGTLAITTTGLSNALVGVSYSETFKATGGIAPYTWSITWGEVPTGINIHPNGSFTGTTKETGSFTFNVHVTDSANRKQTTKKVFTLTVNLNLAGKTVPANMFNMHVNHVNTPWPSAPLSGQRFWDAGADWGLINTAPGVFDWTPLDQRLADAKQHNVDVLYTMAMTPVWAQCGPKTASSCNQTPGCAFEGTTYGGGPGQCYWPGDLNLDGSGTNQHWKDWVTALAKHSVNSGIGHIKYYEIWNEPNISGFWRGTTAQLVRMAQDASCIIKGIGPNCNNAGIDPNAMMVTPSPALGGGAINTWMMGYLGAGGSAVTDVIGLHGYSGNIPEKITGLVSAVRDGALTSYNLLSKPIFDDEFSWGTAPFPDPDEQSGFVGRSMLLHWSSGVSRTYWYAWEDTTPLWSMDSVKGCTTPDPSGTGFICGTGLAFEQVQSWMVGASLSQQCSVTGTIWTCGLTRSGGYKALAVWDTSRTCSNGVCTMINYKFLPASPNYTHYLDLAGKSHTISGTTVPIGYKPILLANQ
jgi:putative Ig domain-containing protein